MQEALINNNINNPTNDCPSAIKNLRGAPRKYTREELADVLTLYFEDKNNEPYSILEICALLGVTRETLSEWATNDKYGLSDVVTRAKYIVAAGWEKGVKIHPRLAEFLLMNHMGMSNRVESSGNVSVVVQIGDLPSLDEIIARREQRRLERGAVDAQFEVLDSEE